MPERAIEIEKVSGVDSVRIPIPTGGGVVVMEGVNGAGKTEALKAIGALGGDGKLVVRDGFETGRVTGLGAAVTAMKTNRRRGDLEVHIVSGSCLDEVIDPQIADPERADAARIKALIQLTGATLTQELVERVLGMPIGDYGELPADAVEAVSGLRRWLQQHARDAEAAADQAIGKASALAPPGDLPVSLVTSGEAMRALQEAIREAASVKSRFESQQAEMRRAEAAKQRLADMASGADAAVTAEAKLKAEQAIVDGLEAELKAIEKRLFAARENVKLARQGVEAAVRLANVVAELRKAAEATIPAGEQVTAEAVAAAAVGVENLKVIYDKAVAAEKASKDATEAEQQRREAELASAAAKKIREAADRLPTVFAKMLSCERLTVEDGRLYVLHPDKPRELFSRLSFGQKVRLILPMAVRVMQPDDVLVLAQHICEGLDPIGFQEMVEAAKEFGIVIATARATDDPTLVARVYQ